MPGYKLHISIGVVAAGVVTYLLFKYNLFHLSLVEIISLLPIILIYSILPDMDISSSKISNIIRIMGLVGIITLILFDKRILAISACAILLILQLIKHRKFVHTITAGLIFSSPLVYFNYIVAIFAFISYFSHLLMDGRLKLK